MILKILYNTNSQYNKMNNYIQKKEYNLKK